MRSSILVRLMGITSFSLRITSSACADTIHGQIRDRETLIFNA
jgi:hypothetical protein